MQWHLKLKGKKKSGGSYSRSYKKERQQRGRDFVPIQIGKAKIQRIRTRGGGSKFQTLKVETANVVVEGKTQKTKIIQVKQNSANPQFVRSNIITKGAVIETELGLARVTSRPGQTGSVDAVLVEKK